MAIKRYGVEGSIGTGGTRLPFARATSAGGFLFVSGQTPMVDGQIIEGDIDTQARVAIQNCVDIMAEAGFTLADVVHVKVILTDAAYFHPFNAVFKEFFGEHPPSRICQVCDLVIDVKVEVDVTCYREDRAGSNA